MQVQRVIVGPLEANCWIVDDGNGGPALVIDPGDDADAILERIRGMDVSAIILTHCHFDHLGAVHELMQATGAPLMVHVDDAEFITTPEGTGGALFGFEQCVAPPADVVLVQDDVVTAGEIRLKVLHTPGHTPGGICLEASQEDGPLHLFSGDTLFAGSVGRTDFPRGSSRELAESISAKLSLLPPSTVVHPGHGPDTTIEREQRINPFWPRA